MINEEIKLPIQFNEQIEFDIEIRSLPNFSKFCFCLFSISKKKKVGIFLNFLLLKIKKKLIINIYRQYLPLRSLA